MVGNPQVTRPLRGRKIGDSVFSRSSPSSDVFVSPDKLNRGEGSHSIMLSFLSPDGDPSIEVS